MQGMVWVSVHVYVHICISILGLVLGEKEEVFAQRAGEFRHLFAAMVGCAGSVALPLLDTSVDLHQNVCEVCVSGTEAECCIKFLDEPGSSLGVSHGCCANSLTFERCVATDHVRPLGKFNSGPAQIFTLPGVDIPLLFPPSIPLFTAR